MTSSHAALLSRSTADWANSRSTALDGETGQGARRDNNASAGEQDADLDDGQILAQPLLDALFFGEQAPPGHAMAVGAMRADPLEHLADELFAQLLLTAGAVHSELDGGGDVAPRRLSIDAHPWAMGRSPSPRNQRRSASLTWTTDTSLNAMGPPRQRLERPSRMSFRPALVDPQGGPITGKRGGPMSLAKPATNWSHVAGKRHSSSNRAQTAVLQVL